MNDRQPKNGEDFVLGSKATDLWLYTCHACANDKIIPKKFRYTVWKSLMEDAEFICSAIEEANGIDLREDPEERLKLQKKAMVRCQMFQRKISKMLTSADYPGITSQKAATWTKLSLTVRYMCAAWHGKDKDRAGREKDVRR